MRPCSGLVRWIPARVATIAACVAFVLLPDAAFGHEPTLGIAHYPAGYVEEFDWGTGVDGVSTRAWLRSAFQHEAETEWPTSNPTKAPRFQLNTSLNANWVRFQMRAASGCGGGVRWYACTQYDPGDRWGQITFADDEQWCQETGWVSGCLDVERVAVHELGHVAGLARSTDNDGKDAHSQESQSYSVMQLSTPRFDASGSQTHRLQECDLIELQREYDIDALSHGYPACVDHIAGTTGGKLDANAPQNAPSPSSACPNEPVVLSGALQLEVNSAYGQFSGNPLASRTVLLQRRPIGGSWINDTQLATGSSGAWTRTTAFSSGTYEFRVYYAGESTINAVYSNVRSVTWSSRC